MTRWISWEVKLTNNVILLYPWFIQWVLSDSDSPRWWGEDSVHNTIRTIRVLSDTSWLMKCTSYIWTYDGQGPGWSQVAYLFAVPGRCWSSLAHLQNTCSVWEESSYVYERPSLRSSHRNVFFKRTVKFLVHVFSPIAFLMIYQQLRHSWILSMVWLHTTGSMP